MKYSFDGFGENVATFGAQNGVAPGMPVKMTANGTVGLCSAVTSACLTGGTAPVVGWQSLAASGGGKVQTAASGGRSLLVVDVDEAAGTCGVIL